MASKTLALLAPFFFGALWYAHSKLEYSRTVDRPPAEVTRAIADLDIREQPGTPGTDPAASGGVQQRFLTERGDGRISFVVMSGEQVATRMTAYLEPLDGGKRTRVTAEVERGDAPDARISPAFRSTAITQALFVSALDDEVDEMLAPQRSAAFCDALRARLGAENAGMGLAARPEGFAEAMGNGVRVVIRVGQMERELRRNGCLTSRPAGAFRPISNEMGRDVGHVVRPPRPRFEPGQPMIDVSRNRDR